MADVGVQEQRKPKRVQRKRTKGWKMPPNTVYVGLPTKWGNPFKWGGNDLLVRMFRQHATIDFGETYSEMCEELRGKDLACWCPLDQPCHADVLLEIANREGI